MARLVVQATESGFALHATGPTLRRALWLRIARRDAYADVVTHDTKPTSYVWAGLGFRYPVASTRGDLDVVARAGARLWSVLGLSAGDALLSAVPTDMHTEHVALQLAAIAAGAPAVFAGAAPADVVAAARLAAPTVLAARSEQAVAAVQALSAAGLLSSLRTMLLVGAPDDAERDQVAALVPEAVRVLAVHAPAGARVLWGECAEAGAGGGLHTYPDLEVVQLVDPESGEPSTHDGEVVLTQLGMYGSALLRWRTGDVTRTPVQTDPCPGCKRRVPRVTVSRRAALVLHSPDGHALDLRAVGGALSGRPDLADWRVVVGPRSRDARRQVVVHLRPNVDDLAPAAVGAAKDIRSVAGMLPTQIVVTTDEDLAALDGTVRDGDVLTRRIRLRG